MIINIFCLTLAFCTLVFLYQCIKSDKNKLKILKKEIESDIKLKTELEKKAEILNRLSDSLKKLQLETKKNKTHNIIEKEEIYKGHYLYCAYLFLWEDDKLKKGADMTIPISMN